MPHLFVPLHICNGTVAMLYNFWDLAHLIKHHFCVWCEKCAKYLVFGTFTTLAVGALTLAQQILSDKLLLVVMSEEKK